MLVEFYDPVAKKNIGIHTAPFLYATWKGLSAKIIDKNSNKIYTVVGMERSGKSTWTFQQAKIIDPTFSIDSICFTPQQFLERIKNAHPGSVVVFDEAFRGFSSKSSQSRVNKALVQAMMEVGRRNLIIFIVLPSFNYLEHYIAVHRSRGLFQIYEKSSKKYRAWKFFSRKHQPKIYHMGKKNYGIFPNIKTKYIGKFFAHKTKLSSGKEIGLPYDTFDFDAYDNKKIEAFEEKQVVDYKEERLKEKMIEYEELIYLKDKPLKEIAAETNQTEDFVKQKRFLLRKAKIIRKKQRKQALEDDATVENESKEAENDGESSESEV